ncbi:hypothetical protein [Pseudomonas aeruginosa]|uniref:hypothetical protein n=1 Tax=Pseudomonas aeruginosa TaxID=287 RepID=UPI002359FEA6
MSQKTEQDSRPIAEAVDLPEISVEHPTEFLTGSAPCAGVSRPLPAAWLGQRGIYRSRLEAVCNGEQLVDPLTLGELIQHAWRYLYLTRRAGLGLKPARQPLTSTTKTPEATDAAVDQMIAEEDADIRQNLTQQAEAERPELWAVHAQGPDELYAAFSREDAEKHAAELNALPMPEGIAVGAVVVPSPWPEAEHWKYLAEQEREHVDVARAGLTQPSPAQAENAEVERPEGSADLLAIVREAVAGAYNEWKMISEAVTEIMEAHERIVGELRAENAKLSEDLNRLSIIRARLNLRLDVALDKISKLESRWPHGESPEERFEHYISNTIDRAPEPLRRLGNWLSHVLDEDQWTTAERMLTGACVAAEERAAAQTQHSVPDGYRLIRLEHFAAIKAQLNPEQVDAYRGRNIYDEDKVYANWNACRSALDEIKDVFQQIDWDAENELAELLAAAPGKEVPQAWLDVQAERRRQVEAEGWTPEHDDEHDTGALASAAGCYAMFSLAYPAGDPSHFWPWDKSWWKPSPDGRRNMVKAGALILAEIERLDRVAASQGGPSDA